MIEKAPPPLDLDIDRDTGDLNSRTHAGFDYAATILRLREWLTYEQIGHYMGYKGGQKKTSVGTLVKNRSMPLHDKGEMLWALYELVFNEKPPMSKTQRAGLHDDAFLRSVREQLRRGKRGEDLGRR